MVSDKQWDDYMWGMAGAQGGSVYQQLGYQNHHQPTAPGTTSAPTFPQRPVYAPSRPQTEEERAEAARRQAAREARLAVERANRARLTMLMNGNRSTWDVLFGRVRTYLNERGELMMDDAGHLTPSGLVRSRVHRQRLRALIERKARGMSEGTGQQLRKHLGAGRVVCPINYHGDVSSRASSNKGDVQPLAEFDRRLRAHLVHSFRRGGSAGVREAIGALRFE